MTKIKAKTNKEKSLLDYYGFTKAEQKRYPVITRILKQLTPERIKKELKEVQKVKLPLELQKWVKEYEKVGERKNFFWKFMYRANQLIAPFNVPNIYRKSINEVKFLIIMFVILLDDTSDKAQNKKLLIELSKIPYNQNNIKFTRLNQKEKRYLKFMIKLWYYIEQRMKKYSRYKEFRDIFEFDFTQTLNTIKYNFLVNRIPRLINKTEYWMYSPYTLLGMVYCNLDLMNFSKFNIRELNIMREIFWRAQKMARIGNCLSTWERELNEGDLTSGLFAYAISSGLVKAKDSYKKNEIKNMIIKIDHSNIEHELLKEWQQYYDEIYFFNRKTKSISIKGFLSQLEKLILMHLSSEGYK